MILRPRQTEARDRTLEALRARGNTLLVAPTGAGKTVMLSAVAGTYPTALVVQHRDELVAQNRRTFHAVNGSVASGVVDADTKQFHRPYLFGMIQTLSRPQNLARLPKVDLLVVDEAHHAAAKSYLEVVHRCREQNPALHVFGATATPNRGDGAALRSVFDNVSDQITLAELIRSGNLVKPRTFVVDLGVRKELEGVRKTALDFDMAAVEKIMDKRPLNDEVVKHWKEKAGDRLTVAFASTVEHANHVAEAFNVAGVAAGIVTGDMAAGERDGALARFARGETRVLVNVAVLTEGWDCPVASAVLLLRPSSYKSTMIQMIGRGLRTVDPEKYPGVIKSDCVVLDFGTSTLTHGSLDQDVNLDGKEKREGAAPTKECPACEARVPMGCGECPLCGHVFERADSAGGGEADASLAGFGMVEVDLVEASPFKWEDIWGDQSMLVATAFESWAIALWVWGDWHAIGGTKDDGMRLLASGGRDIAIAAADDYLRTHGDQEAAAKSRTWLHLPATEKQLGYLQMNKAQAAEAGVTRYGAACRLTWAFNQRGIRARLEQAVPMDRRRMAA